MLILFLLCAFFCVYTYALFPLSLAVRARRLPPEDQVATDELEKPGSARVWPVVSVVIAAHNEEQYLPAKLASLAALDYPVGRVQVVIVSDGSSDSTAKILAQTDVTHAHYAPAKGKPSALNHAMTLATGEYIVFMDARQMISTNALKALIARFDDPTVGAVSGELSIGQSADVELENVGLYWKYEKWIRLNESRLYSTTGATGALYAVRKDDVPVLRADVLLDDFEIPVKILALGKRCVFEPSAKAFEVKASDSSAEFQRKVRTLAGNFQSFARNPWLFNPSRNPVFWQLVSHKFFRLLVPLALLLALVSAAIGQGWILKLFFILQLIFYALGLLGIVLPASKSNRVINLVKVFLQLNFAVIVGAWCYFTGTYNVRWKAR